MKLLDAIRLLWQLDLLKGVKTHRIRVVCPCSAISLKFEASQSLPRSTERFIVLCFNSIVKVYLRSKKTFILVILIQEIATRKARILHKEPMF